ncbi:MAG TPA: hypothetical protein ENJ37_01355 [Deltaproteobacteria bacterium]|nr:hypothetical protein [Deltaproteobacteria bacterium]
MSTVGKGTRTSHVFYAAILLASLLLVSCQSKTDEAKVDAASLRGGETRETLSPAYFTGKAARAYQIAKEIPDVLDSIYCYCDCKPNFGHKSLLTCYVDQHAMHCDVCMNEALMAYDMYKQGMDVVEIRAEIDRRFARKR